MGLFGRAPTIVTLIVLALRKVRRRTGRRACIALTSVFVLAAAVAFGVAASAPSPSASTADVRFDKRYLDPDAGDATAAEIAGDYGEPKSEGDDVVLDADSAAWEDFMHRAYPADTVPVSAQRAARDTWNTYGENKDGSNSGNNAGQPFVWDLVGPTHATQPGILSFSGAQLHMSGRVTALALTPTCTTSTCRLWVAEAGGGIWRTDNPFSPDPYYTFVSQTFKSNAIGTLDQDPNDPTGNTLYAGTGEPNASGDSEAGIGIYKTADGGKTWTLLPGSTAFESRSISKVVVVPGEPNHLYVGVARGVRGVSSATGGAFSRRGPCIQTPLTTQCGDSIDQTPLGLYESTDGGQTFHILWAPASLRGVNDVAVDPNDANAVYAAAFQQGIWRCSSKDACVNTHVAGTTTFQQIFQPTALADPLATQSQADRTQFALTTKNGATRIYAEDGAFGTTVVRVEGGLVQEGFISSVWRADNVNNLTAAQLLATQTASTGPGANPPTGGWAKKSANSDLPRTNPYRPAYNPCTGQCWYDEDVYTPKGYPDVVYVLGSYSYGELRGPSNARGLLLSKTAGDPDTSTLGGNFTDLTWDDTPHAQPDETHPDFHAFVTPNGQPFLYFVGTDGGVTRSDGTFDNASDDCAQYHPAATDPDSQTLCRRLLSRVPHQLYDTLNKGLSTLQFQSVSLSPKQPLHDIQGGTQDNGTFDWDSQLTQWNEEIYGDGGQSGFNYCNDQIRFNTFFTDFTDENFRGGQPQYWTVTSGPLDNSGESVGFYMPIVTDYTNCGPLSSFPGLASAAGVAANANTEMTNPRLGFIGFQFAGLQHVWRTVDNGGPQDYLEANCPEFTTFADDPKCGDWKALGADPLDTTGTTGDLTGPQYGADRQGGTVAAVERDPGDSVTLWAATSQGRVFVSHNANAPDPSSVQLCRVDVGVANAPQRFVTSIYPDPNNANRAWISYSGYNITDPGHPGHVFEVTASTPTVANAVACPGTWRDLNVENGTIQHTVPGDIPVTDLVRDDYTGDLYAATDFGVLRNAGGNSPAWTLAGSTNFPYVEVPGLTIDPCSRVLYAATHGRSVWRMFLPPAATAPSTPCPRTP